MKRVYSDPAMIRRQLTAELATVASHRDVALNMLRELQPGQPSQSYGEAAKVCLELYKHLRLAHDLERELDKSKTVSRADLLPYTQKLLDKKRRASEKKGRQTRLKNLQKKQKEKPTTCSVYVPASGETRKHGSHRNNH